MQVVQVTNFEMGKLADTKKSLEEAMRLYRATNYGVLACVLWISFSSHQLQLLPSILLPGSG